MIRHVIQEHPYSSMIVAGYIGWLIALYMVSKEQARKDDVPFVWFTWQKTYALFAFIGFLYIPSLVEAVLYPIYCLDHSCPTNWTKQLYLFAGSVPVWIAYLACIFWLADWYEKRKPITGQTA